MQLVTPLIKKPVFVLILSWLSAGFFTFLIALFKGLDSPLLPLIGLIPLSGITYFLVATLKKVPTLQLFEKVVVGLLSFIWLIHSVGLSTPEVGFDAVWYHLPVLHLMVTHGGLTFHPDWYQALNPVFSDLLFSWGYVLFGELGAKITAYALGISWLIIVYELFKIFLPRLWSLAAICVVSLFQPIAWQTTSFYVDIARSFWELSALFLLIQNHTQKKFWVWCVAGLCFGAALATKLFLIIAVPFWFVCTWLVGRWKGVLVFVISCVVINLPFWLHTTEYGGSPLYPLHVGSSTLHVIGGAASWSNYVWQQTIKLWWAPWYLSVARDYASPLLVWCSPLLFLVMWRFRNTTWRTHTKLIVLIIFFLVEMGIWWYLPPVSTRYALTGFTLLWLLEVWAVKELLTHTRSHYHNSIQKLTLCIWLCGVVFGLLPRLAVTARTVVWLSQGGDAQAYYASIKDGFIDGHLRKWHEIKNNQ